MPYENILLHYLLSCNAPYNALPDFMNNNNSNYINTL